jgi:hypothetical protein
MRLFELAAECAFLEKKASQHRKKALGLDVKLVFVAARCRQLAVFIKLA